MASSYALGRFGSTVSPLLIGLAASRFSLRPGIGLLGIAYAICALVPGMFIPEKAFDPKAIEPGCLRPSPDRLRKGPQRRLASILYGSANSTAC